MLKKSGWILITLLVVSATLLSACSASTTTTTGTTSVGTVTPGTTTNTSPQTTTTTTPLTTTTTTTTSGQPEYGGKINFVFGNANATGYFDPVISAVGGGTSCITYDKLLSADWSKGPAGTNDFNFGVSFVPLADRTGMVAESWDVPDLNTVIWHIRKGIYFQDKAPAMGAELTAADVVYSAQRGQQDPRWTGYSYAAWTDSAGMAKLTTQAKGLGQTDAQINAWTAELHSVNYPYDSGAYWVATDQWTVKYRVQISNSAIVDIGDWLFVESAKDAGNDMNNYKNACGSGAYIVSDAVPDSSITWTANPNYWETDPVHPGNKLPYVTTLNGLIIIDTSTQLAALRTQKVDILGVDWDKAISLEQTNPELQHRLESPTGADVIFMRTDLAPWSDVRVRQALSMGIDRDSIINNYYKGNAIADAWPSLPGISGYTPISQMPADVKQLFEYHPDISKQLLSAAGYPNGITAECDIYQSDPDVALLTLVAGELQSIGVNLNIKVVESATHTAMIYGETYPATIYSYWGNSSPPAVLGWAHGGVTSSIYNFSKVVDPLAVTAYSTWAAMADPVAANTFLQQEYLREDKLVWEVPLPTRTGSTMWQPYLKGYQGEINMGLTAEMGSNEMYKFMWIDSQLKSTMVK